MSDDDLPRRRLLAVGGSLAASMLAGCSSDGGESAGDDGQAGDGTDDGEEDKDTDDDSTDGEADPDLREANVVGVEYDGDGESYTVDVTLHHDDDGEDGYANWWQVERLDGTQLGRRELLHAHSQQPFERSETISIPADMSCVVVRGHDQTHGYGGRAMLVNLDTGETRAVEQGSEATAVQEEGCP
jgi:hypothetical protein